MEFIYSTCIVMMLIEFKSDEGTYRDQSNDLVYRLN
jgi:hypothetical protein